MCNSEQLWMRMEWLWILRCDLVSYPIYNTNTNTIRLHVWALPTHYPTHVPTTQPTSEPSEDPTTSPTLSKLISLIITSLICYFKISDRCRRKFYGLFLLAYALLVLFYFGQQAKGYKLSISLMWRVRVFGTTGISKIFEERNSSDLWQILKILMRIQRCVQEIYNWFYHSQVSTK